MSICVVTHPVGATATAMSGLLDILSSITNVCLVSANVSNRAEIPDDHEIIEVSTAHSGSSILNAGGQFVLNQIRMCQVIRRRDEEVIWFFGATAYLLPILFSKLIGKTVVLQPRGDVPLSLRLKWERRVPDSVARLLGTFVGVLETIGYRLSDAIVTYTPSMAEELNLDRYEHKLHPEGARFVDIDHFYPRISYKDREMVVGFLGRLEEEKGIRTLTQIARLLSNEITFVFVGDGAYREWVENELDAEIEAGRVHVTGWVLHDQVPDELSRLRLLIMPSAPTEGLPMTILESFACGTPGLATPVSGVPDVVFDEETGYLIEDVDPDPISSFIEKLLESDLDEMSDRCRQLVEDRYTFSAAVDRYRIILSDIHQTQYADCR